MNLVDALERHWLQIVAVVVILAALFVFRHEGAMIWRPIYDATEVAL